MLVLKQLIEEMMNQTNGGRHKGNEKIEEEIAREKKLQLKEWLPKLTSNEKPINPYRFIWDMMHTFDREYLIITHESGNPREQLTTIWEFIISGSYLCWEQTTKLGFS